MFLTSEKSLPENIPDHIRIKLDQLESYVRNFEHIYRMRRKDTIVEYLVNAIDFNENQVIWRLEIYVDYALLFYDEIWVKKDNYDMVNGFVNNIFIKLISYSLHSLVEEKSMITKVGIKDENGNEQTIRVHNYNSIPMKNSWNMSEINGKTYSWFCIENVSDTECLISVLLEIHDPLNPFNDYTAQLIIEGENDKIVHNGIFKWLTRPQ